MPIQFAIHPSSNLVTCKIEHIPSPDEAREFFDVLLADPKFECGFNLLADCRGRRCDLNPAFARAFSKEIRGRSNELGPCRWAFVTMKASDFTGVRLIALLSYGSWVEFAPFMNMEDAAEWVEAGTAERRALVETR